MTYGTDVDNVTVTEGEVQLGSLSQTNTTLPTLLVCLRAFVIMHGIFRKWFSLFLQLLWFYGTEDLK